MLDDLVDELLEHRRETGDLMDRAIDAVTLLLGKIDVLEEKNALLLERAEAAERGSRR